MKHFLLMTVLAVAGCTETKQESEVTTETTAAAVTGKATTTQTAVTTETTAAAVAPANAQQPIAPTTPPSVAPTTPPSAAPATANLLADEKKSAPAGCERLDCPKGTRCMLVDVQCIQAPCPPMPECRPETEMHK
jgi:hypothetical protein